MDMDVTKLMNRSFLTRTISGAILVAVLLVTGLAGGYLLFGFTLVISLIAVSEMLGVMELKTSKLAYMAYAATIVYYLLIGVGGPDRIDVFLIGYLMAILAVYVITYPRYKTDQVLHSYFAVIYGAVLMSYIFLVRNGDDGHILIWLIFLCSWGCDTCAYLTGVTCGKHKMASELSPKKTVEGAVGGIVGAFLLGALYGFLMQGSIASVSNPVLACGCVCALGGGISMIGDLAASAIKRNYDVKDYGTLIPGHGGILDRFDSVLFTAPIIFYFM